MTSHLSPSRSDKQLPCPRASCFAPPIYKVFIVFLVLPAGVFLPPSYHCMCAQGWPICPLFTETEILPPAVACHFNNTEALVLLDIAVCIAAGKPNSVATRQPLRRTKAFGLHVEMSLEKYEHEIPTRLAGLSSWLYSRRSGV